MRTPVFVAVLCCSALVASEASAARKPLRIPLVWRAERPGADADVRKSVDVTLALGALADARIAPDRIGENHEDGPVRLVVTSDDVPAFCRKQLEAGLRNAGFSLAQDGPLVLRGELIDFLVTETSIYEGSVRLKMSLHDPEGKSLWSAVVAGRGRRFGRSYSAENYQEAISEALLMAITNLIEDEGFQGALAQAAGQR